MVSLLGNVMLLPPTNLLLPLHCIINLQVPTNTDIQLIQIQKEIQIFG